MEPQPNDFWYTPPYILERVSAFLGNGYFDPCPVNPQFNGLIDPWGTYCYINPPYSKDLKRAFIKKALHEFSAGKRFLWLVNYACSEDLADLKGSASAICLPHQRVKFIAGHKLLTGHPENPDPKKRKSSPMYDNIFVLWGNAQGFSDAFSSIGTCFENGELK